MKWNYANFISFYLGTKLLQGATVIALPTKIPFEKHSPSRLNMQVSLSQVIFIFLQWWYGAMSGSWLNISSETSSICLSLSIDRSPQSALEFILRLARVHFALSLYIQLYFLQTTSIPIFFSKMYNLYKIKVLKYI